MIPGDFDAVIRKIGGRAMCIHGVVMCLFPSLYLFIRAPYLTD